MGHLFISLFLHLSKNTRTAILRIFLIKFLNTHSPITLLYAHEELNTQD